MNKYILYFIFLLSAGCATYKANQSPPSSTTVQDINAETTNIFLVGDAGQLEDGTISKALTAMQENFAAADKNDVLLFLGDNIYPKGLPSKKDDAYGSAKKALEAQIEIAKKFPGKVSFIPGNHDWYNGLKGLKRQEEMVEKALGKNTFKPEKGCSIDKIKISDDIVLLLVDSQWYISDWNKYPTINDNCDIKTRELFLAEFRSEIKKARGKTTLVAMHHPMYSNGPHNGQYTFNQHMKPIPVLGSLKNILRTTGGVSNADMSNWFYNDLRKNIIAASQQNSNVIFLSGHEHSLQFIQTDNLTQIISGSGSKASGTKPQNKEQFGAGVKGYAILNIHKNSTSDIQFLEAETNSVIFKKVIHSEKIEISEATYPKTFKDSVTSTVFSKEETTKSSFYKFLWGERFRKYYSEPIKVKTVDLDTLFGGLKPLRKGGGNQSRSLRLINPEGKQYVMRALKKSATQYIQAVLFGDQHIKGQFNDTETEALVADIFTGAHPYTPLTVATLSEAAGVYHLNPKLFYIPKQNALKEFNSEFGNELYFIEEHASEGHSEFANGNFTGKIISTMDLFEEIHKDENTSIDQESYIKARLFDMLIGDWDRHQDQWRWMKFKENGKTIYRALPRDRDQAYSKMSDGLLLSTFVGLCPEVRLLRKYSPDLKDVKGVNIEPYPLDKAFLLDADKTVWDAQVAYIKKNVTDKIIEEAFLKIPKEVQDQTVTQLIHLVKQRRSNLQAIADRYYKFLTKYPVVTATNKDDYISIKGFDDGKVELSLFRKKDGEIKDRYVHKIYTPEVTKEIWIYGLDDDDTFDVISESKKIKIVLIGGQNKDEYIVNEGKNIVIYDYKSKKNDLTKAKKARIKLTDDYETHAYNFRKKKSFTNSIHPTIGYNPDDGVKIGFSDTFTKYGFQRNPFTNQHKIKAAYYFGTKGFELLYKGEVANVIGNINFQIQASYQSPNYTYNFFGYGNETVNTDAINGIDYNRVKIRSLHISPSLVWDSKRGSKLNFGVNYETIDVGNPDDRFVDVDEQIFPLYIFNKVQYAGVNAAYTYINYDNNYYPTNGLLFSFKTGYTKNIDIDKRGYGHLIPSLSIARKLNDSGRLVLATTLNGQVNIGNGYEFYQAASIGGENGLRGFRNQRFTGKRSYYQNTDIRYSFNDMKTALIPIKIGLFGSFDYGRIWITEETSEKWHTSYGGGLFVSGAQLLSAKLGLYNSIEGTRLSFGLGFGF
tara:strand:+ start:7941 stop:11600 length:3660 start_codon:yes stop_codon:yes gene_type:complete